MFQKKIIVWPMLVFNYPVSSVSSALAKTKLYVFLKQWIWPRRWKQSLFGLFHQNPFTPLTPFIKKKKKKVQLLTYQGFLFSFHVEWSFSNKELWNVCFLYISLHVSLVVRCDAGPLDFQVCTDLLYGDETKQNKKKKLWRMIKDVKEMVFMQFTIF